MIDAPEPESQMPSTAGHTDQTAPPLRHIARALVFDPQDRLLLIAYEAERSLDPAEPEIRTFWFMPGGGLEPGETHEQACCRELSEEIGVHDAEIGPQVA